MGRRKVQTHLVVTCDVFIDDEMKRKVIEQYSSVEGDEELAKQLLFAYLNPKLPLNNDLEQAEGEWDTICKFKGRFSNIRLTEEEI